MALSAASPALELPLATVSVGGASIPQPLGSLLYSDNAVRSIRLVLKICCSKSIGLIWNLVYTIQSPLVSKVQK